MGCFVVTEFLLTSTSCIPALRSPCAIAEPLVNFWGPIHISGMAEIFTARCYANRGICRRRPCVCLSVWVSVCLSLSLCLSVTLQYCNKTAKHRITQIMPLDSPKTLVFWHQSSRRNSNGITPYGGDKCR